MREPVSSGLIGKRAFCRLVIGAAADLLSERCGVEACKRPASFLNSFFIMKTAVNARLIMFEGKPDGQGVPVSRREFPCSAAVPGLGPALALLIPETRAAKRRRTEADT
ncbi:MAG: hypothetical protein NXI12_08360 [Alphaproteobacteria bacterium]|nr:hypothetical protein [Alphaproteobacteria bacterium]